MKAREKYNVSNIILTNDEVLLKRNNMISKSFRQRKPIDDYKILLNAKSITTQLSSFCSLLSRGLRNYI